MDDLKDIDIKIIHELLKNAKISDRTIAKRLGVSQPTVTRRRGILEKEVLDGYTAIPKWTQIGYELLAMIFIKTQPVSSAQDKYLAVRKRGEDWLMDQPNVIMGGACEGMGFNAFILCLHKNYGDYDTFIRKVRRDMGDLIVDIQTILVNLAAQDRLKPFHLKYLAQSV